MKIELLSFYLFVAACGAFSAPHAKAQFVLDTNESQVNADDSIDWSSLGATYTLVDSPFAISTQNGNKATVSTASRSGFQRLDENNGWNGVFPTGASLLYNLGSGPITIDFAKPVAGLALQIQPNYNGHPFTAQISLYDSSKTLLASFQENSTPWAYYGVDNPLVIGAEQTAGPSSIASAVFSLPTAQSSTDFAIGNVSVLDAVAAPEPSCSVIILIAFALLVADRFYRVKAFNRT